MNAEQLTQMQHMLAGCLNPDNGVRIAAERTITQHLNDHREVFIFGLVNLIRTSPDANVRVLSAIILRQTLPQGDTVLFVKLSDELQTRIKHDLLQAVMHEPERYVRSQISDTVASLASVLIYKNAWPELFPALYSMCVPTQSDSLKVCALGILGKLSDAADNLLPQIPQLYQIFLSMLPAANNALQVREAAAVACCKIVPLIEEKSHTREYQKLVPLLLQALSDALATGEDEDVAKHILAGLTEVATEEGKFFEKHLEPVVSLMYAIGADTLHRDLDEGTRQYACEVLIGMAESAPAMARKSSNFIKHTILVCMALMLCVEEDPEWGNKQDSTDFYDNSNFDCGEMNMDRLAEVVKGTKLWPVLEPILNTFVSSKTEWRMRHAGLFALAQTAAVVAFEKLPIKQVCGFVRDPHPRVRYAAVQCLGQFPVDFELITQQKHHKSIYPALMEPLKDFAHPRLQMHAASALLNVVDGTEPRILKQYFGTLMSTLITLLQQSSQMVQEQVMPTMAALAGQAPEQFLPYYEQVMPLMKLVIVHATTKQTRRLRAKAMESASFIGMYCGKEMFHKDALEIMQIFLQIQKQSEEAANTKKVRGGASASAAAARSPQEVADDQDDDYSEQHMLQAWTRICTCLREEFVPVLPYVMPRVFEAITRQSEQEALVQSRVHKLTGQGGDDEEDEDANVGKDGKVKTIFAEGDPLSAAGASRQSDDRPNVLLYTSHAQTAAMEEKALAMSMLCSFCHDLQEHFLPYIKQSAEVMIPLVDHMHEEVQAHAIACMPHLFKAALAAHRLPTPTASLDFCRALLEAIVEQLVEAFPREHDSQTLQTMVTCLHDCMEEAGPLAREVLSPTRLNMVGAALLKMLAASHQRIERREQRMREEEEEGDMDEERIVEMEGRNVGEDGLNAVVASCIEALIKSHQGDFIPVFDQLFPEIQRMLGPNMVPSTRKIAIFIIDDVIEHLTANHGAAKYFPHVLEAMCIYACDMNEEHGLRQAAAYGIGLAAKHGGASFAPFKGEIVKRFIAAIQSDPTYLPGRAAPNFKVGRPFQPKDEFDDGAVDPTDEEAQGDEGDEEDEGQEQEGGEEEDDDDDEDSYDERSRFCALDNMVSALGHIILYQGEPSLLPTWLSFLPMRVDEQEAASVYNMLLSLLESNNAALLGAQMERLPQVIGVLLQLEGTDMLKKAELRARWTACFRTVKQMPPNMLQGIAQALPQNMQQQLAQLLARL